MEAMKHEVLTSAVRPTIKALQPGEKVRFAVSLLSQVRNACYTVGLEEDKRFRARMDKETKTINVEREK